jgi:hypothetical protein
MVDGITVTGVCSGEVTWQDRSQRDARASNALSLTISNNLLSGELTRFQGTIPIPAEGSVYNDL